MADSFGWLEVRLIGELLAERHPGLDPYAVRFTELKSLVAGLPGFEEEPGHPVNERILEEIQRHWIEEREDAATDDE
ncbi:MAG: Fe-S cluster assembly protein IscX [Phycisphaerales bacterium]